MIIVHPGSSIAKRLIAPISKTGRNKTMDNLYTLIPLSIDLLENHKLTIVGTIRKNKRQIPKYFLDTKKRDINSTMFGKNIILLSFVPRKNKNLVKRSNKHKCSSCIPPKITNSHFPTKVAKNEKKIFIRKKCKVCHSKGIRKTTIFYCSSCEGQPGLCLENCFENYRII